ncbi:MAG: flagellar motor protein MotB [Blastocatellia bacterium]
MKIEPEEKKSKRKIVKKVSHGGHHGGAWKVAYADFVTAMMALFLVLWLVSQGDQKLKEQIANYFRSPGVFTSVQGGILGGAPKPNKDINSNSEKSDQDSLKDTAAQLRERFSKLSEFAPYNDQIKITLVDEGLLIQLVDKANQVSFESGSSELTLMAGNILKEISTVICNLPNPIQVSGHTDAHPYPSNNYTNWELSTDRANAARRLLVETCVEPTKIKRVVGYADTLPLIIEDPFAAGNRRISIMLFYQKKEENTFLGKITKKKSDSNKETFSFSE